MGVRRSSSDGNADRVPRKEKVYMGRSRSSGGGVRFLELKSGKDDEDCRKVRVAIGKSKGRNDGVRIIMPKKNGNRMGRSRGNGVDSSSFARDRTSKDYRRGERDLKTKSRDVGFGDVTDGNSGRKRKRIYGDPATAGERSSEGNVKKLDRRSSRSTIDVARVSLYKGKKMVRREANEYDYSGKNTSVTGGRRIKSELLEKKNKRSMLESAEKPKHVQENGFGDETLKRSDKKIALSATKRSLDQRKYVVDSVGKLRKIKFRGKKSLIADSESREDLPKKKKRGIRIDRHDISNKRLDDNTAENGNSQGKKESTEPDDVEMSKNAQFRAIVPSPSILSFVEDNLLGRRRDIDSRRAGYNTELSAPLDNIPFSTSSERERIEVPVFRNKLEFFAAAKISSSFPDPDLPEIAFAGRSNVGKSSLLNALTRQWGVVRTSDKPGLTQTINFFKLGPKLSLVDLPGYGFAYAKEEVKEAWEELVKEYVASRVGLKRVCLLIDTKWGMKPRDHELIDLMERSQTKYQIVLTKTDTVFPIDVARRAMQIEENLKANKSAVQPLMMVSSKTGAGIRTLRTVLANVARFVKL